ncbi:two-component system sensor histidine kinase DegS [Anaerobacterium chartisolvens]|uniref:Oxygen sensor histidine kinase NreB n=1 Tax=Anaerobacterium chartisolvens TaxID=1297424 RepID=A0A369B4K3_9FIRM|nr:sensor histidine kinase [Anaerobacterium chartisolvens]RCX15477.1 two-component system sensor histidine kinase DegS [Anaerobacterium chartisolvens]
MSKNKVDAVRLDKILKKAIEAITLSKNEIYDIAEGAKKECKRLEEELNMLKVNVKELIESVIFIESELKERKRRLLLVSKNHEKYSQEELKQAYEKADNLRIELAVKREQEQHLIRRRNDIEIRIKESIRTVQKADSLISHVGVALGCLTGDLQQLSVQLDDMNQRQLLGLRIIQAQEEERQRVARDMHDGPAQSMSNVVLKAEICERLIDVDIIRAKIELQNLKKIVRDSLHDVRKIIYNLRPMSLDDLGLVPTLQRYIATFGEDTGIAASLKTIGVYDDIKPVISLTVFRIVQEALSNIRKHSKAQNVAVNLEFMDEDLKLYIYDDGDGFNVDEIKIRTEDVNSGFGLLSMKERIDLLSGEFKIASEIGKGTRLNVSIPLLQEEVHNV